MSKPKGWEQSVSDELRLPELLQHKPLEGRLITYVPCAACLISYEFPIARKFPPVVFRKKLQEKGWSLQHSKLRCPKCTDAKRNVKGTHLPQIRELEDKMDAKLTASDKNVAIYVPKDSRIRKNFVMPEGQPKMLWSFGVFKKGSDTFIRVSPKRMPEGMKRVHGAATMVTNGAQLVGTISNKLVENHDLLGRVNVEPLELSEIEDNGAMIFLVPAASRRQKVDEEHIEALKEKFNPNPAVVPPIEDVVQEHVKLSDIAGDGRPLVQEQAAPSPVVEQIIPREVMVPVPVVKPHHEITKDTISLYAAIQAINLHKQIMGDDLQLSVCSEGRVSAIAEY